MAGENPMALEAQGIDVLLVRSMAVILGSALMAIGGAYLTMSAFSLFVIKSNIRSPYNRNLSNWQSNK